MKITDEFINEQRAIAAKATPRPWWKGQHHEETIENLNTWLGQMPLHHEWLTLFMVGAGKFGDDGNEDNIRIPAVTGNGPASEANMDYIVEAANNYPAALDEIERLRERLSDYPALVDSNKLLQARLIEKEAISNRLVARFIETEQRIDKLTRRAEIAEINLNRTMSLLKNTGFEIVVRDGRTVLSGHGVQYVECFTDEENSEGGK